MVDQIPPRPAGGERETLCALLQFQRESFVRKVTGVDETAARTAVVGSGTTLLWLTRHLAHAEQAWVVRRFAGLDMLPTDESEVDSLAAAIESYQRTWAVVDDIVASAPTLEAECRNMGGDEAPVSLRWVLMHLLEETARHAGHADILRELIDGGTGR